MEEGGEEEEGRKKDEMVTWLFSGESERCVTLVVVKGLLRRISHRDSVTPSGATGGSHSPIGSNTCHWQLWVASAIPLPSSMRCGLQSGRTSVLFSEGFFGSPRPSRNARRATVLVWLSWRFCLVRHHCFPLEGPFESLSSLQLRKNGGVGLAALES